MRLTKQASADSWSVTLITIPCRPVVNVSVITNYDQSGETVVSSWISLVIVKCVCVCVIDHLFALHGEGVLQM